MKKLYRSRADHMISGVCGGIAEFFGLDTTLVRLGFAFFACFAGSGLLFYIIAAIVIPKEPI